MRYRSGPVSITNRDQGPTSRVPCSLIALNPGRAQLDLALCPRRRARHHHRIHRPAFPSGIVPRLIPAWVYCTSQSRPKWLSSAIYDPRVPRSHVHTYIQAREGYIHRQPAALDRGFRGADSVIACTYRRNSPYSILQRTLQNAIARHRNRRPLTPALVAPTSRNLWVERQVRVLQDFETAI